MSEGAFRRFGPNDEYVGWWPHNGLSLRSHEWAMARALSLGEISQKEIVNIQTFDGERKTISSSAYHLERLVNNEKYA